MTRVILALAVLVLYCAISVTPAQNHPLRTARPRN